MSDIERPEIRPTEISDGFWSACAEGRLVVQSCAACGRLRHYPQPRCPDCLSDDFTWRDIRPSGSVYTYTVARRAFHPAWRDHVPYALVIAELDDGVRMFGDVVGPDAEQVAIGQRLEVVFETLPGQGRVPRFRLIR